MNEANLFLGMMIGGLLGGMLMATYSSWRFDKIWAHVGQKLSKLETDIERVRHKALIEGAGWAYSDCCSDLDDGKDPRKTDLGGVYARVSNDFGYKTGE